jgi:hypothetical protein
LVNKSVFNLNTKVDIIHSDENFIVLKINHVLLVNLYLPCVKDDISLDKLNLILDLLVEVCLNTNYEDILVGGDFNCNVLLDSNLAKCINAKLLCINAIHSYNFLVESSGKSFTFSVPSRNAYSHIDFFFCSPIIGKAANRFDITFCDANLSDHLPIKICLPRAIFNLHAPALPLSPGSNVLPSSNLATKIFLNWDLKRKDAYYEATRLMFFELSSLFSTSDFSQLIELRPDLFSSAGANTLYKNFTHGLLNCSLQSFEVKNPKSKGKTKWWWDESLREAKENSLSLYNQWRLDNFQLNSPIYTRYCKAKKDYKHLVRSKKNAASHSFNDKLLSSLTECNSNKFWQIWKSNFKTTNSNANFHFDGLNSELEIANFLADNHKVNCSPNSQEFDDNRRGEYLSNKVPYRKNSFHRPIYLTITQIENAIHKIPNNSTPGFDNIAIEHLKFAHPSVISILKTIYNIFLFIGEVPHDFGAGIVTPIPKFKGFKKNVSADDFRGITINVMASKIFEHAISYLFNNIVTSDRQFGFKKGTGCNHALHQIKNITHHFNSKRSTINIGCIDIKKAFDKANCWGILLLLQKKCIHPAIIETLEYWFSVSSAKVNWGLTLSDPVLLSSGVRQGGILSPLLFAAYIDILLGELELTKLGCFINAKCMNSYLYADDLLLVAISVTDLQLLVDKCVAILNNLDLRINCSKSACLRVGPRFAAPCLPIYVGSSPVEWTKEIKYLGIHIKGNASFTLNWRPSRSSYYKALNGILGALGSSPPLNVILSLARSTCFPILSYGIQAFHLTKSDTRNFSYAYNNIFCKMFKSNDASVIALCQYYCHIWPFSALYDFLRFSFLSSLFKSGRLNLIGSLARADYNDMLFIANKYNIEYVDSPTTIKFKIWKYIEHSLLTA